MDYKKNVLVINIFTLLTAANCAYAEVNASESGITEPKISLSQEANTLPISNTVPKEVKAYMSADIQFQVGSSVLTEEAKSSLNTVLEQAKQTGKVDEVILLSWSDAEYPSKNLKKLSKVQRELAKLRNEEVTKYLKSVKSVKVDAYNMAEKPNALSKWLNTNDNKLKKTLLSAGLPTTSKSTRYANKASHSVVLVKIE